MKKLILTALLVIGIVGSASATILIAENTLPKGKHNAKVHFTDVPTDLTGDITLSGAVTIPAGASDGYVFTSDADGIGTWQEHIHAGGDLSAGDNEVITGNWVFTAFPMADNEVADDITIGASGQVDDAALSANVSLLGQTIEDGEVSDTITVGSGGAIDDGALSANVSLLGQTIEDGEVSDTLTIGSGSAVADGALSANVSLLGASIQDAEVDDDLTISASGQVADGALSSNVLLLSAFVFNEVPTGLVDGANKVFTSIAGQPLTGTVQLFVNGLLQKPTTHYSVALSTITFVDAPEVGDTILIHYIK